MLGINCYSGEVNTILNLSLITVIASNKCITASWQNDRDHGQNRRPNPPPPRKFATDELRSLSSLSGWLMRNRMAEMTMFIRKIDN